MTAGAELRPEVGFTPLPEAMRRLEQLTSPYVGIVKDTVELLHDTDDVRSFYVGSDATDALRLLGHPCNTNNGGGAFGLEEARAAAIGETVERYSGAYLPEEELVFGAAAELDLPCVEPEAFALFHPRQHAREGFPFTPFTAQTPVRWVEGRDLRDGSPAWLPAQLVFLNSRLAPGEARIAYSSSSGLACRVTHEEAVLNGLLELVERDAVMICWHAMLSAPRLDLGADPALARVLARHVRPAGLPFEVLDLTAFCGVPVAFAVVRNEESDLGALAVGAAAAPRMADAAMKALLEAFQTRTWAKSRQREEPELPAELDLADYVVDFDDHVRLYGERAHAAHAAFLTASPARRPVAEVPSLSATTPVGLVREVVDALARRGVQVFAVDATSPDVAEAGLRVVKVVSPQLQPLDVGWTTRMLGGRRLYDVPRQLGLRDRTLTWEDLNPHPHPFP